VKHKFQNLDQGRSRILVVTAESQLSENIPFENSHFLVVEIEIDYSINDKLKALINFYGGCLIQISLLRKPLYAVQRLRII